MFFLMLNFPNALGCIIVYIYYKSIKQAITKLASGSELGLSGKKTAGICPINFIHFTFFLTMFTFLVSFK
jgi:hypothetical protein